MERADYEGPNGKWLSSCPNCKSTTPPRPDTDAQEAHDFLKHKDGWECLCYREGRKDGFAAGVERERQRAARAALKVEGLMAERTITLEAEVERLRAQLTDASARWSAASLRNIEASGKLAAAEAAVERLSEGVGRNCPCKWVEPCSALCTCANAYYSGGCRRCCTYGSLDQRRANAARLAAILKTFCESTGKLAVSGACPEHHGDACLICPEDTQEAFFGGQRETNDRLCAEKLDAERERDIYRDAFLATKSELHTSEATGKLLADLLDAQTEELRVAKEQAKTLRETADSHLQACGEFFADPHECHDCGHVRSTKAIETGEALRAMLANGTEVSRIEAVEEVIRNFCAEDDLTTTESLFVGELQAALGRPVGYFKPVKDLS